MFSARNALICAAALAGSALTAPVSQYVYVPHTCDSQYRAGRDVVIHTVPYPYDQVMAIMGDFKNLTWSGNPPDTVRLNGTDNTPGTARFYSLQGVPTVETLMTYERPPFGPYYEVHNTALVAFGAVEAYIMYDGTHVTPICGGQASLINMTANYCSNLPAVAEQLLHTVHLADAQNVGTMLGGRNFTDCGRLSAENAFLAAAEAAKQVSGVFNSVGEVIDDALHDLSGLDINIGPNN